MTYEASTTRKADNFPHKSHNSETKLLTQLPQNCQNGELVTGKAEKEDGTDFNNIGCVPQTPTTSFLHMQLQYNILHEHRTI